MKTAPKPFCWYSCAIMTTLNHMLISLSHFEIVSMYALIGPETAVSDEELSKSRRASKSHQWFKSYGHFTEGVDVAYRWSCIGKGLRSRLV